MKYCVFLFLAFISLTSWSKIITKAEVKKRFIEAVRSQPENFNYTDANIHYELDEDSVEVSLPENPFAYAAEFINYGSDYYEITAYFTNEELDIYRYNVIAKISRENLTSDTDFYSLTINLGPGNWPETARMDSFYRLIDGKTALVNGEINHHSWIKKKSSTSTKIDIMKLDIKR